MEIEEIAKEKEKRKTISGEKEKSFFSVKNKKQRKEWEREEMKKEIRKMENVVLYRMRECRFQGIYIEG